MKLYLVRHGQTDWNLQDRIQGWADIPLNATGIKQAERLRDQIREKNITPETAYASPLKRVRRTAEIITDGRWRIVLDERLKERDVGQFEGRPCKELFDHKINFLSYEINSEAYGVEPIRNFRARAEVFLRDLKDSHTQDAQILVVSSNGLMKQLHMIISGASQEQTPNFQNGEVYVYEI